MIEAHKQSPNDMLFVDFYELTMAQLYYRAGIHDRVAQFEYFFRTYPDYGGHSAGYCINAGCSWFLDWLQKARFDEAAVGCLREMKSRLGASLFADDFLSWLARDASFDSLTITAIAEGRVIHPVEPIIIVQGPLAVAQLVESALLNHCTYQTLVATKAARMKQAGRNRPLIEFGMRRAQDGAANAGTRAALIGGADFSSNTGISCALGFAPKGTHAHSMVQAFIALGERELDAFLAYADVYPDDCVLLVDTVDTLRSGVPNAITVFEKLRKKGHVPVGIRLDSGDLAYLSIQAAKMLDTAGFHDVSIVLSNQVDEMVLLQVHEQIQVEAPRYGIEPESLINRLSYGVGTRLVTSYGHPALDGVYKLVSLRSSDGWTPVLKLSETQEKTTNPGEKRVWRIYTNDERATADYLCLAHEDPGQSACLTLHHPVDFTKTRMLAHSDVHSIEPLHEVVFEHGRRSESPSIETMRKRRDSDLASLDAGVKRFINPHRYHISLSDKLWKLKQELVTSVKKEAIEI